MVRMVRMVRSLADRTFQLWRPPVPHRLVDGRARAQQRRDVAALALVAGGVERADPGEVSYVGTNSYQSLVCQNRQNRLLGLLFMTKFSSFSEGIFSLCIVKNYLKKANFPNISFTSSEKQILTSHFCSKICQNRR